MDKLIIVDSNEAAMADKIITKLREEGIEIRTQNLEYDYYIPSELYGAVIERKTVLDLLNSVKSKRLWNQLERMTRVENADPYLILEGNLNIIKKFTKWDVDSVAGIILSIPASWNIPIIPSMSEFWTVKILSAMVRRYQQEKLDKLPPLRIKLKTDNLREKALFFLCGLPMINRKRAEILLETFKSPIEAIENVEFWKEIKGFGNKIVKEATEILYYTEER